MKNLLKRLLEPNLAEPGCGCSSRRRFGLLLSGFLVFILVPAIAVQPSGAASRPQYEIKLATLAPENSSLMQIFNEMNEDLLKQTEGKVGFKMYAGFALGDEEDVLRKLRIGLVNAAVFTATALTDMNPDLRALQVPFFFDNYEEVDYVLDRMDEGLKRSFSESGFEVLGWPELGFLYLMSNSPIGSLEDLKGKKVWTKANMPMSAALIKRVDVSAVAVNVPDILMALQTNLVDVVYNSPYYALVTQWYTQVKYITDMPLAYVGGALLIDKKVFARIPAQYQDTLRKVVAGHLRRLVERTRKDNAEALQVIFNRGVERVTPGPAQAKEFKELSDKAMADLIPEALPADAFKQAKSALAEYRSRSHGK